MRLEKVVVRRLVGMLKLFPLKSLEVHWMFSVCTSGEASEIVKFKETLISGIPTILPWTACTVGGTERRGGGGGGKEEEWGGEGGGGGRGEEGGTRDRKRRRRRERGVECKNGMKGTTHDSSSAVCNVVCWWMRPEVQLVQVSDVTSLQCIWWCVVEGLLQYLVQ